MSAIKHKTLASGTFETLKINNTTFSINFSNNLEQDFIESIPVKDSLRYQIMSSLVFSYGTMNYAIVKKKERQILYRDKERYNFLNDNAEDKILSFSKHGHKLLVICRFDHELCLDIIYSRINLINTKGWMPNYETVDEEFSIQNEPTKLKENLKK